MTDTTPRHSLPMIAPGQSQKELAHNEALAVIDLLLHPAVEGPARDTPPGDAAPGQAWLVGPAPTAAWRDHPHHVAGWTGGGWRFAAPRPGMTVRSGDAVLAWNGSDWAPGELSGTAVSIDGVRVVSARQPAIADPAGGASVDPEARAVLAQILVALRQHGLIAR